jgi:flagellar biosynthesis protein FlhB
VFLFPAFSHQINAIMSLPDTISQYFSANLQLKDTNSQVNNTTLHLVNTFLKFLNTILQLFNTISHKTITHLHFYTANVLVKHTGLKLSPPAARFFEKKRGKKLLKKTLRAIHTNPCRAAAKQKF